MVDFYDDLRGCNLQLIQLEIQTATVATDEALTSDLTPPPSLGLGVGGGDLPR